MQADNWEFRSLCQHLTPGLQVWDKCGKGNFRTHNMWQLRDANFICVAKNKRALQLLIAQLRLSNVTYYNPRAV